MPSRAGESRRGAIRVGCSGWQYKGWRGDFYPAELPMTAWFAHYAKHFDTVELNNPFYSLPTPMMSARWKEASPPRFLYAWKASRFLTHMKKLKDPDEPLSRMLLPARVLGRKLGPFLYQLPPHWGLNAERLDAFLRALPTRHRHVIEVREPTWYSDEAYALMNRHKVALCLHDMAGSASPRVDVGPLVYVRFHGATGKYYGSYPQKTLDRWAEYMADHVRRGVDAFAYFNNDAGGHAPWDALRLREAVEKRV